MPDYTLWRNADLQGDLESSFVYDSDTKRKSPAPPSPRSRRVHHSGVARMSSSLDLSALTALAHLVRERNFTGVARRMGITPSAVSKAIARLEQEVGAKLVTRNSRSMALTPEGVIFHARCHELLVAVEEAKRALSD